MKALTLEESKMVIFALTGLRACQIGSIIWERNFIAIILFSVRNFYVNRRYCMIICSHLGLLLVRITECKTYKSCKYFCRIFTGGSNQGEYGYSDPRIYRSWSGKIVCKYISGAVYFMGSDPDILFADIAWTSWKSNTQIALFSSKQSKI